jgi:hypothetical protein
MSSSDPARKLEDDPVRRALDNAPDADPLPPEVEAEIVRTLSRPRGMTISPDDMAATLASLRTP